MPKRFGRKKKFYEKQDKNFFFTYSYEYYEGTVLEKIFKKLDGKGISYDPPPKEYIDRRLGELYTDDTYNLIARCVKLAKANDPPPSIDFQERRFCFTGTFAYGSRSDCKRVVESL